MNADKRDETSVEEVAVEVVDDAAANVEGEVLEPVFDLDCSDEQQACYTDEEAGEDQPTVMEEPAGVVDIADESTLSIDGGVVEKIVAMTCREIDGVLQLKGSFINSLQGGLRGNDATKGVSVEMFGDDACTVNVAVILEFGKSAPRVFQELHDRVAQAIETMTGLKVNAVNVRVTNVLTRAEAEGGKRKDKAEA
jgi:uncharacterized alkaline shock family protein YloU